MKAMILSAGRGERMRPLTDATPKPLLRAGGRALIEYHLDALSAAGIKDIVINLGWLGDKLRQEIGNGNRYGVTIEYSHESPEPLETGGGIFRALPLLGADAFWVVNGDVWTDFAFTDGAVRVGDLGKLILVANPEHNQAGDFALEGDRISNSGAQMLTYSGIAVLRPELFAGQQDGIWPLAPLLRDAADRSILAGEHFTGRWMDTGTPERLQTVDQLIRDARRVNP
jgi:MurNAc alpha-1-phosphate uridylyltransferase